MYLFHGTFISYQLTLLRSVSLLSINNIRYMALHTTYIYEYRLSFTKRLNFFISSIHFEITIIRSRKVPIRFSAHRQLCQYFLQFSNHICHNCTSMIPQMPCQNFGYLKIYKFSAHPAEMLNLKVQTAFAMCNSRRFYKTNTIMNGTVSIDLVIQNNDPRIEMVQTFRD